MPTYLAPGVFVEEVDSGSKPIEGVGTAVAAFVGLAKKGPANRPTLVTNWTQFTDTFGEISEEGYLAHAVYGFFLNGGGQAYIVRIGGNGESGPAALPPAASAEVGQLRIKAVEGGPDGNDIEVEFSEPEGEDVPEGVVNVTIRKGDVVEDYEHVPIRGRANLVTTLNRSALIDVEIDVKPGELEAPPAGKTQLSGGAPPPAVPAASTSVTPEDYVGDVSDRTGFGGLEAVPGVTMVAVPDAAYAYEQGLIDLDGFKAVQLGMIAHCELMGNRVAILDPPPSLNAQQVEEWRMDQAGYDSKMAALYYPWIRVFDPVSGGNVALPPSGHIAGVWSRNDDSRGVHKAPANEVIRGVVDLDYNLTSKEQELLNPDGVNCIRAMTGRGIRVWGARTLSSDPSWRYVNIRRFFNYLEDSILLGTQWAVFEPNDQALWAKIRRSIAAFLVNEWRKGALFGSTPAEAFYVKCDDETNPAEAIDAGQVTCEIGVAPVKPAEFVIFRLAQFSGGTSLVAE
jgi:Bacteriophage tail sheath protein